MTKITKTLPLRTRPKRHRYKKHRGRIPTTWEFVSGKKKYILFLEMVCSCESSCKCSFSFMSQCIFVDYLFSTFCLLTFDCCPVHGMFRVFLTVFLSYPNLEMSSVVPSGYRPSYWMELGFGLAFIVLSVEACNHSLEKAAQPDICWRVKMALRVQAALITQ